VGVVATYLLWWLVQALGMPLLSQLLTQFVNVGVIILIIIFQPEVRRFLLLLGNTTLRGRSNFLRNLLEPNGKSNASGSNDYVDKIRIALSLLAKQKAGALIVLSKDINLTGVATGGVDIGAEISVELLMSIFNKTSPLHDGAVIIANDRIEKAGVILPVSTNQNLPKSAGLRHRAAAGVTERASIGVFVVSEETGIISYAFDGKLQRRIGEKRLGELLLKDY